LNVDTDLNIKVKQALIAVAEARIAAYRLTGDAANAAPTATQSERINYPFPPEFDAGKASFGALRELEAQPLSVPLYAAEGGYPPEEVIAEIRRSLYA
jgi:hypothetical protein